MQNWWVTWPLGNIKHGEALKKAQWMSFADREGTKRRASFDGRRTVLGGLGKLLVRMGLALQKYAGPLH